MSSIPIIYRRILLHKLLFGVALTVALISIGFPEHCIAQTGEWVAGDSLAQAREGHTATVLTDGRVLVVGGQDINRNPISSAEIYDAEADNWTTVQSMQQPRYLHTATLLDDGRVLVVGGNTGQTDIRTSVEIYDPANDIWTQATSLNIGRSLHSATLLRNGHVLVAGGKDDESYFSSAEIYDPTANTWTFTGNMAQERSHHTATLLQFNGHVVVAGGTDNGQTLASVERYNPDTGKWITIDAMSSARGFHTATAFPGSLILVTGGMPPPSRSTLLSQTSVELYDFDSNNWTSKTSLDTGRRLHTATLLENNLLLVVGGYGNDGSGDGALDSTELYNRAENIWADGPAVARKRQNHTASLLPDGRVLVVGGRGGSTIAINSVEIYDEGVPPDCYTLALAHSGQGIDPSVTSNPSSVCPSGAFEAGNSITVQAGADQGWHIAGWTGASNDSSTASINSLTMPASNHTVTVIYEEDIEECYSLYLSHSGQGIDPYVTSGQSGDCPSGQFKAGTNISLGSDPAANWHVARWSGTNNDGSMSTTNTVTMPASSHSVTVIYEEDIQCYMLSLAHTGSGNNPVVTSTPLSACPSGQYEASEVLTLQATPAENWLVASWLGTNNDISTSTTNVVTMPAENHAVSVNYERTPVETYAVFLPISSYNVNDSFPNLVNGNFDSGSDSGWTQVTDAPGGLTHDLIVDAGTINGVNAVSSPNVAWLGGTADVQDELRQWIELPASFTTLQISYRYMVRSNAPSDQCANDRFRLDIYQVDTGWFENLQQIDLCSNTHSTDWQPMPDINLISSRGEVEIRFSVINDGDNESSVFLDDVKLCDGSSQHPCN